MKPLINKVICAISSALAAIALLQWPIAASGQETSPESQQQTNVIETQIEIPQSVFIDDPGQGVDPFFPHSVRRPTASAEDDSSDPDKYLTLNFILGGSKSRRLAVINNRIFSAGDTYEITVNNKSVLVRCLEIRTDSVLVLIVGSQQQHELKLKTQREMMLKQD